MRVNARLGREYEEKIRFLLEHTGANLTQLLKQAIDLYFREVKKGNVDAVLVLRQSGFVGCASGPDNLSETYKEDLHESLEGKW